MRSKIKAKKRQIQLLATRTYVEVERDYRWWRHTDVEPACGYVEETDSWTVPVQPVGPRRARRRQPHVFLSRGQMRARLYAVGVRGPRLRQLIDDIKAGPANGELQHCGRYVLDWPEQMLKRLYGRRIYRSLTRFVAQTFFIYDELSHYLTPGLAEIFNQCRSIGFMPVVAQQQVGSTALAEV